MTSLSERKPSEARISRTSSAMKLISCTTLSAVPVNFLRSSSFCVQTPTGQVFEWHWRTMMQPMATSAAVPMPYSSAPIIAAMTMSRPVRKPPSVRKTMRWRRLLSVSSWLASVRPISHGTPAYLIDDSGEAPVPPTWPEIKITSARALATPAAMVPMPVEATSFTQTRAVRVDLLQVVDQLRQIFDRIDVVMRRRRDQHHAGRRVAELRDHLRHFEAGQLAALAGLGALGDFDFDFAALVQIFRGDAEAAGGDLLDRRVRVVAVGARLEARGVFAAFAGVRLRADAVHGDVERAVRLGRERAQRHAGRHEALADFGDRFDFLDLDRRSSARTEIHQMAQAGGRGFADRVGIAAKELVALLRHRALQQVDRLRRMSVGFAALAIAVEAADGQRRHVFVEGADVIAIGALLDAAEADAGNARGHAGEILGDHRAREADGFEIVGAAIGRDDRDAHLGNDLEQARVDAIEVALDAFAEAALAEQAARVAVGDAFLREIGVDGRRADADQHGEVMRVHAFGRAHVDRGEGAHARLDEMRMHGAGRQDHRDGGDVRADALVGQNQMRVAGGDRVFGLLADAIERRLERAFGGPSGPTSNTQSISKKRPLR